MDQNTKKSSQRQGTGYKVVFQRDGFRDRARLLLNGEEANRFSFSCDLDDAMDVQSATGLSLSEYLTKRAMADVSIR